MRWDTSCILSTASSTSSACAPTSHKYVSLQLCRGLHLCKANSLDARSPGTLLQLPPREVQCSSLQEAQQQASPWRLVNSSTASSDRMTEEPPLAFLPLLLVACSSGASSAFCEDFC